MDYLTATRVLLERLGEEGYAVLDAITEKVRADARKETLLEVGRALDDLHHAPPRTMTEIYPTEKHWRAHVSLAKKLGLTWIQDHGGDGLSGHWVTDDQDAIDKMAAAGAFLREGA